MSPRIVEEVALEKLAIDPQVRRHFDEESLDGLAQSLRTTGMLQPILARREGDRLVIVDGERRFRAAQRAGLANVPVIVEQGQAAEGGVLQQQLVANCQREDFRPLEKAAGMEQLMASTGWTATQAAKALGLSGATLTRLPALLTLPQPIRDAIESGAIPASAGYELTRIEDPAKQTELANEIIAGRMTRDGISGAVKAARRKSGHKGSGTMSRATAPLGDGQSVSLVGRSLSLESVIAMIENLLAQARKARTQGLTLPTFLKVLRDSKA